MSGASRPLGCLSPLALGVAACALVGALAFLGAQNLTPLSPGALATSEGEPLGGVRSHAELSCGGCHPGAFGAGTVSDRCLDCHSGIAAELRDELPLHGTLRGADACLDCHTEHRGSKGPLTKPDAIDHERFDFSLGAHVEHPAGRAYRCIDCHDEPARSYSAAACTRCHDELAPGFKEAHVSAWGEDCVGCHDGVDRFAEDLLEHDLFDFALTGRHREATCAGCHRGARSLEAMGQAPRDCVSCHEEPEAHRGRFGTECGSCHTTETWEGADVDHDAFGFSLTGAHRDAACASCHGEPPSPWPGPPRECVDCHREPDAHRGQFGTACASCHSTETWEGARFSHDFPLDHGRRGDSPCATCHPSSPDYQRYTCYGCHEHSPSEIRGEHLEEGISDFRDCARCHPTGREHEGGGHGEWGDD